MHFAVDLGNEIDKTGFSYLKSRALAKAIQLRHSINGQTIGENLSEKLDEYDDIKFEFKQKVSSTPSSSFSASRRLFRHHDSPKSREVTLSPNEEEEEEEAYCSRKILAELQKLTINEAQAAKFLQIKKWNDYKKQAEAKIAEMTAQDEAQALIREQEKLQKMSKHHEELLRRHQELTKAQINRDQEASSRLEESKKLQEEADNRVKEKLKQKEIYDQIYKNQLLFSEKYKVILESFKVPKTQSLMLPHMETLRNANDNFYNLVEKCKSNGATSSDVTLSSNLIQVLDDIEKRAKDELETLDKEEKEWERLQAEELEKQKLIEQENKKLEEKQKSNESATDPEEYLKTHNSLLKNLENVQLTLSDFTKNESCKKVKNDIQKAVNITVNAISPVSDSHLNDKFSKLLNLLRGETIIITEKRINASQHPHGMLYAMYYLAEKIVKQGEQVVSCKPEAAFAIASVSVGLWTEIPEFGKLLLACFHKSCPYLIPIYWERTSDQTEEEYYRKLGFLYSDGEKEELNKFLKRQSGVMTLYTAIIISSPKSEHRNRPHPLPISEGWRWLTIFISLEPKPDISATLLLSVLETTGFLMLNTYKNQFLKLLHLICKSYLPLIEKVTPQGRGGPVSRLKCFLENIVSGNSLPPPKDLLPTNFW